MKFFTPVLFLSLASTVQAQWTSDVSVNTTVRAVTSGEAAVPLTTEGPDGSTYVCWFENGSGEYQLRMQRLDAGGNRLWDIAGLVVSDHPQNSAIFRYDLQSDGDGKAIVAFQDERTGVLDIVAYKIAPDGTFIWGPDGVELPTTGSTGLSPRVAALENGNTVVTWSTDHDPGRVAYQLITPNGSLLLPEAATLSASTRLSRPVPIATDDGGFILQYALEGSSFLAPATMKAQRFNAAGTAVWADPVTVSSKTISGFFFPQPVSDEEDGLYVAFNTGNPDNASYTDVYVQRVRANGTLWSAEGTRLDNSATTQKFTAGKGLVLMENDGQDGLMVPMQVTDGSQGQSGVAVQRVDTAGVRQLGNGAVTVIPVSAQYVQPWDIAATHDGAVIAHQSGAFGQVHLAATRVDLSGATVWVPAQMDLCTANSNKDDLQLTEEEDGQVVAVWKDDRSPEGIYAQHITGLELGTAIFGHDQGMDFHLEENPASSPVLLLPPDLKSGAVVQVLDAQGRLVYSAPLPPAYRVRLPLEHLPEGLFTIRIGMDGKAAAVRWLK
ncbi:MAG: T9SS type A sorting domain-containing protein [Flavobacteriales bacterium]|nr:T9SS type A sorting domain-containing protein [Flavobacteriales bacterium]